MLFTTTSITVTTTLGHGLEKGVGPYPSECKQKHSNKPICTLSLIREPGSCHRYL